MDVQIFKLVSALSVLLPYSSLHQLHTIHLLYTIDNYVTRLLELFVSYIDPYYILKT